jgi:hypothetical protein
MKKGRRSSLILAILMAIPWSLPISFFSFSVIPRLSGDETSPSQIVVSGPSEAGSSTSAQPTVYTLSLCEKRQFTAKVIDASGREIIGARTTWKSNNPEIVRIDDQGVAMGVTPGATVIKPIFGTVKSEPVSLIVRPNGRPDPC